MEKMILFGLLSTLSLILSSSCFVLTEFAAIKIRPSRIDQLIAEGDKRAINVKKILSNLDGYLSACQLGITVIGLALGSIGEPAVYRLLHPLFQQIPFSWFTSEVEHNVSWGVSFGCVTYVHMVIGELSPKSIAIRYPEKWILFAAKPLILFYRIAYPFIWVFNKSTAGVLWVCRIPRASEHDHVHSEEELRLLMTESYESGEINSSEYKYVNNIFEFTIRSGYDVMTPRIEMVTMDRTWTIERAMQVCLEEKYTRYPLIDEDKDHVIGMVHIKDIIEKYAKEDMRNQPVTICMREVLHVLETIPINELLLRMQRERNGMAVLMNEYGGTAGIVTMEDLLEEIVGEIQDEFDQDETPMMEEIEEDHRIVNGKFLISDINDLYGIEIPEEEHATIGGWMLSQGFEHIEVGYTIRHEGFSFTVLEADGRHIERIRVHPVTTEQAPA